MSLGEKTVYPQLAENSGADNLTIHFTPTEEEIIFVTKGARLPSSRLSLLVLLKLFQHLHRFPDPAEIPTCVVDHLRIQLRLGAPVACELADPVQRTREQIAIREYTGVTGWSKHARHVAAETGLQAALVMARPADITNAIVAALTNARFELPTFSTVERIHEARPRPHAP